MSFTTIAFIVFFAVVFVVYYLVPKKVQWMWLLAASVFFYMYTLWWGIFFLIGTVAFTYALARLIDRENALVKDRIDGIEDKSRKKEIKARGERIKRLYVGLGVAGLVLLLVVMRYTNLAVEAIEQRFSIETGVPSLLMPLGLSFYVFQTIGYLVDVGRGTYPAERNFFKFLLYISYFPHVLQGPLDDYQTVSEALYSPHTFDETASANGIRRAMWGFFKKLVIANQAMMIISSLLATGGNGDGLTSFVVLLLYALWIYADFSGYMDIAIGCSTMLGIPIAENFDSPYLSGDIAEYWRRWHSTLGAWFRNYLFYPLLRSKALTFVRKKTKKSKYLSSVLPTAIALAVVWVTIGFWHGAQWSYLVHGVYHGFFIILGTLMAPLYDAFHKKFPLVKAHPLFKAFRVARTFLIVLIGYAFFSTGSISLSLSLLQSLLTPDPALFVGFLRSNLRELIIVICSAAALIFTDFYRLRPERPALSEVIGRQKTGVRFLLYVLLLLVILFFMAYGGDELNQFAYFKF